MNVPAKEKEELNEAAENISADELTYGQPVQFSVQYQQQDDTEQTRPPQEEMTRRDREILAALDEVLQKNRIENEPVRRKKRSGFDIRRFAVGVGKSGSGLLSLALTLIFMGIVPVCVALSPEPDYLLIAKLSPIAAALLGIELLLGWFVNRKRLRVNIPCVGIIAVMIAVSCVVSVSLNKSEQELLRGNGRRVVEAEIYEASYKQLRHSADIIELTVTADLLPGSEKKTMETLSAGDKVEIAAVLDGNYSDPLEFAAECRRIIEVYDDLEIPVESFRFSAETRLSSFALEVDGLFRQDMSDEELAGMVRYIYFEDYDYIPDLEDFTEEVSQSAETVEIID